MSISNSNGMLSPCLDAAFIDTPFNELSEERLSGTHSLEQLDTFEAQNSLNELLECSFSDAWTSDSQFLSSWSDTEFFQIPDPDLQSTQSSRCGIDADPFGNPASSDASSNPIGKVSSAGKRNKSRRLSKGAVTILRSWLYQHKQYPYPTPEERDHLQQETGLSRTQIAYWFSNARRRKLSRPSLVQQTDPVDISQQSPLERWKNSPPQSEAAATTDIIRALETMPPCDDQTALYPALQQAWSSDSSSASFIVGAPSMSSFEHSQSSGSEISALNLRQRSQRPPTPMPSHRPRRRRRKPPRLTDRKAVEPRPYQCTFCTDSFRTKYDWARHEKTLHLPIDRWPCAPQEGIAIGVDGTAMCVFCQAPHVDENHLNNVHDYLACREKPREQRTFDRKDHLRQHLKLSHGVDYHPTMDAWHESRAEHISSRCGFCNAIFTSWNERVDHIAEHFKSGADMIQWNGDWGFTAEVQQILKNAMLPYLLGLERHSMDPWKSSVLWESGQQHEDSAVANVLPSEDIPNAYNRYTILQEELVAYIRGELARGVYPSDQMLMQKARQISYGDDDPWNQTYADYNPMWLAAVKLEAGMTVK